MQSKEKSAERRKKFPGKVRIIDLLRYKNENTVQNTAFCMVVTINRCGSCIFGINDYFCNEKE